MFYPFPRTDEILGVDMGQAWQENSNNMGLIAMLGCCTLGYGRFLAFSLGGPEVSIHGLALS